MIEETYRTRVYDPLGIEDAFQKLVGTLAGPMSGRWRLLAMGRFLRQLDGVESEAQSYLLQVAEHLPALAQQLDPVGLAPEEVIALVHRFERVPSFVPDLEGVERFETAMKALRVAVATLHAYAGDVQAAFETVAGETPAWLASSDGAPLERLEQAAQAAEAHSHPTAATLARLVERWKAALQPVRHSAVVPVVERPVNGHAKAVQAGGLRRLRVELFGEREEADHLRADVPVLGKANGRDEVLKAPVLAARRLLAATYPSLAKRYVAGQVRFDEAEAWHEGRSADLAVAALLYGAVLRFTRQRAQYRVAPDATLTGQLDAEGHVLPVEEEALRTKVRTAFFSWVQCLAVPATQLSHAQTAYQELVTEHPGRRLDIVGVNHLREVFYDRRLSEYHKAGLTRHVSRKAWERKFSVASLVVILLLTLTVGRLLYGPIDKNPVMGEFVGEMLVVKNQSGEVVDEIWVGASTVEGALNRTFKLVSFVDADGDGVNEVIWSQFADKQTTHTSFIHAQWIGEDSARWTLPLKFDLDFPNKPDVVDPNFKGKNIIAGDLDGDGDPEVWAILIHEKMFPSLLLKLDARNGVELARYLHTGHLGTMETVDLDDDGVVEILLGGTNNAFDEACLIVLDPRFVAGHAPLDGDYQPVGYDAGLERAYLRIPGTKLGKALPSNNPQNVLERIEVRPSENLIEASIRDIALGEDPVDMPGYAYVIAYFDFNLGLRGLGTSSEYDRWRDKLEKEGTFTLADEHIEEFRKRITYWDGETWQNKPVMNQRYLKAVAEM